MWIRKLPLLLLLVLPGLAYAGGEAQVLIDAERNGAVQLQRLHDTDPKVRAELEATSDFARGLSVVKGTFEVPGEAPPDGRGGLFADLRGARFQVVGDLDVAVPEEEDAPERVEVHFEQVYEGDRADVAGRFELEVPTPQAPPVKVEVKGSGEGGMKDFASHLDFTAALPPAWAQQPPLRSLDVTLSETSGEQGISTTLALSLSTPATSPIAPQVRGFLSNPDAARRQIMARLQQMGITVTEVQVDPLQESEGVLSGGARVTLRGLRPLLVAAANTRLGRMVRQQKMPPVDPPRVAQALQKVLETRLDNLALRLKLEGDVLSGSLETRLSNLDRFLDGYYDYLLLMAESAAAKAEGGALERFMANLNVVQLEHAGASLQAASNSRMRLRGEGQLAIEGAPPAPEAPGKLNISANLQVKSENYRDFVEKARAAGFPVRDRALILLDLKLAEGNRLKGQAFADSELPLDYLKQLVLEALDRTQVEGPEDQALQAQVRSAVESLEVKEGRLALDFSGTRGDVKGYLSTSDLSEASALVLHRLAPEGFQGQPAGLALRYHASEGAGEGRATAYFKQFMPGASATEVEAAVAGLMGVDEVVVRKGAESDETRLAALKKPSVEISPTLARIQDAALKTLLPAAAATGPGPAGPAEKGATRSKRWIMILGGVVVLILIGAGVMVATRRPS